MLPPETAASFRSWVTGAEAIVASTGRDAICVRARARRSVGGREHGLSGGGSFRIRYRRAGHRAVLLPARKPAGVAVEVAAHANRWRYLVHQRKGGFFTVMCGNRAWSWTAMPVTGCSGSVHHVPLAGTVPRRGDGAGNGSGRRVVTSLWITLCTGCEGIGKGVEKPNVQDRKLKIPYPHPLVEAYLDVIIHTVHRGCG